MKTNISHLIPSRLKTEELTNLLIDHLKRQSKGVRTIESEIELLWARRESLSVSSEKPVISTDKHGGNLEDPVYLRSLAEAISPYLKPMEIEKKSSRLKLHRTGFWEADYACIDFTVSAGTGGDTLDYNFDLSSQPYEDIERVYPGVLDKLLELLRGRESDNIVEKGLYQNWIPPVIYSLEEKKGIVGIPIFSTDNEARARVYVGALNYVVKNLPGVIHAKYMNDNDPAIDRYFEELPERVKLFN